ncbi:hypothetical protein [Dolichospermum compactum]|uniref:Uncharacterized protein n=1 Tax=Dolichospermum compactum NIES-806 TaxID=1973481 RepID=A0A1Z4V083_9CYAN|nr:hypothetical protein [Dolichospermum compactum]BAZ84906.1 hypothetical protein NIES806_11060 [Dolichospermum compactum NIES-806]
MKNDKQLKIEKIKLMADYECYPLWWVNSDKAGDIDPETQKELAPNYEVVYFSETLRKVITDMSELESLRNLNLSSKRLRFEIL